MSQANDHTGGIHHLNEMPSPREGRCEIVDVSTREVWQDLEPTPRAWYDDLKLEPPFVKVGYGAGNMDRMWFRRSPDADVDGPVRTREIEGRAFFFCARAPADIGQGNPRRMMVDKYHSLAYARGRKLELLTSPEGHDYVLVVEGARDAPSPELPKGWSLRKIELEAEWRIDLPSPTETYWFAGMVSYQGPVEAVPDPKSTV